MCGISPAAAGFSGAVGSGTMAGRPGIVATTSFSLGPPLLYVPTQSLLDLHTCGSLWHPGVLGRETFVELWMFCQLHIEEERQKESLMPPRC